MTDVVFTLSLETFDDCVRRQFCRPPDQVLVALALEPQIERLAVVDAWRSAPVDLLRRRPLGRLQTAEVAGRPVRRVRPRRLRRRDPLDVDRLRTQYARYARAVGTALELAPRSTALVTTHPFVAAWGEADWVSSTHYFARDDWAATPAVEPWWPGFRAAYARLAERCDTIYAVSAELAARLRDDVTVLPNGIDAAVWSPAPRPSAAVAALGSPVAVYAGTVDDRIDVGAVARVARAGCTVAVIGPTPDPRVAAALRSLPGVHLLGELPQDALRDALLAADVGIVPHRDTPQTRAMSPLKLYEYLAAGLPVLATDLPPIAGHGDRVHLCRDPQQWSSSLTVALAQARLAERERQAVVATLAWRNRLRPLVDDVLAFCAAGPSPAR